MSGGRKARGSLSSDDEIRVGDASLSVTVTTPSLRRSIVRSGGDVDAPGSGSRFQVQVGLGQSPPPPLPPVVTVKVEPDDGGDDQPPAVAAAGSPFDRRRFDCTLPILAKRLRNQVATDTEVAAAEPGASPSALQVVGPANAGSGAATDAPHNAVLPPGQVLKAGDGAPAVGHVVTPTFHLSEAMMMAPITTTANIASLQLTAPPPLMPPPLPPVLFAPPPPAGCSLFNIPIPPPMLPPLPPAGSSLFGSTGLNFSMPLPPLLPPAPALFAAPPASSSLLTNNSSSFNVISSMPPPPPPPPAADCSDVFRPHLSLLSFLREDSGKPPVDSGPNVAAAKASALGAYGRDMTAAAAAGGMDPVLGRDDVIDHVVCILSRRTKNSAVLVGEPGVGKTAIAEALAQRIAAGAVPAPLAGVRVVEVDLGAMVAGTQFRGMFEERIKDVIKEAKESAGKVVLFIDEVHMLIGAGQGGMGAMDGANLLKPALARGSIRCVGATTLEEYRKYIENDAAFERRFQKVLVEEPSLPATIAILQGLKNKLEEHHEIKIKDDALIAAVQLANRYVPGRRFPDKAIDLIDEACATANMQAYNQLKGNHEQLSIENAVKEAIVSSDQVAQVVSRWTGIPVTTLGQEEKEKLMGLADRLRERVVGQEEAVTLVAQAVIRSRAGLDQSGQPLGSFLFLGSTGVGKTELAKALAEQLFDSEEMLLRFDMSEFVGANAVTRLIGAHPSSHSSHVDGGGQLTEKVRQHPYSVILFDEIEKADPAVLNIFLQVLDAGILTDGKGRTVDFKNAIIIMTSNVGSEKIIEAIAGRKSMEEALFLVIKEAQKHFKPEFVSRLSEAVIFKPLSVSELKEIAGIQMRAMAARVAEKGITLSTSDAALDVILHKSHSLNGARSIRRWVKKTVITKLSEMLVNGEIEEGTTVTIDATQDNKELEYEVVKKAAAAAAPTDEAESSRRAAGKMPVLDISSDDSDDDIILAVPMAKKMKGASI